jgi:hypothetical protein
MVRRRELGLGRLLFLNQSPEPQQSRDDWRTTGARKIADEAVAAHVFEMGDPIGDLGRALGKYSFVPICGGHRSTRT